MELYKRPGSPYWWCDFTVDGKRVRKSTKTEDYQEAKKRAWQAGYALEASGAGRLSNSASARESAGLESLLAADKKAAESRNLDEGTLRGLEYAHSSIREFFGPPRYEDASARDINHETCTAYVAHRRGSNIRGQSIVRELQCLKRLVDIALDRGVLLQGPRKWPKVKRDPKCKKRSGKLVAPETLRAWLEALPDWARLFAQFVALTGLRRDEALRLEFSDVVGEFLFIRDEGSKTDGRSVPLPRLAWEIVQHRRACREENPGENPQLIFGRANYNNAFRQAAKAVGVANIHPRDLRHTYLSLVARKDPVAAMRLAGHRNLATTEIYASTTTEWLTEASSYASQALLPAVTSRAPRRKHVAGLKRSLQKAAHKRALLEACAVARPCAIELVPE